MKTLLEKQRSLESMVKSMSELKNEPSRRSKEMYLEEKDWHEANHLVKIFDNYAIEFLNYYLHNKANRRYVFSNLSAEEALEKFKQEKNYDS